LSFASETAYEKKMALGIAALESGSYDEAITLFGEALTERPADHSATLYQAIALSRGARRGAEEAFGKALAISPEDPRTNLETGVHYYGGGRPEKAVAYFEKAVFLAPGSDISAAGREYLEAIRASGAGKPWRISLWGAIQYDSNVLLGPDNGPLPQGISRKSDWRAVFYFDGSYRLLRRSGFEISAGYGLYRSLHKSLSDFDVTQSLFTLAASCQASNAVKFGATYLMDYAMVGGNGYYGSHGVTPSVVISTGNGFATTVEYRHRRSHFIDSDLFQGNAERSGSNNAFGVMQTLRVGPAASARIGYAYDEDDTRRDYWDYRGHRGFAGIIMHPVRGVTVDLSGEYYRKTFRGPSPLSSSGEERKDDIYTVSLAAAKKLSDRFSVILSQMYTRNRSNVPAFDFSRAMTTLMLSARF